jgi:chromosome partitioning protein
MRTIAVGNQKGGVGKTTTALNLGHALAEMGRNVLLVDLDPQASLTVSAGVDNQPGRSMAEVLAGDLQINDVLIEINGNLQLAPSDIALSETELILVGKIGREVAVKKALARLGNRFDYALLDLPPSLGILTVNGLAAAQSVLIPAIPQYLDLRALAIFTKTVDLVKEEINPGLEIIGILPTLYDSRLKLHAEVLESWEAAGLPVLPFRVKRTIRAAEAPIIGKPLVEYSKKHGKVYKKLARSIDDG